MAAGEKLSVAMHGVRLVLSSESPEFLHWARMVLEPFVLDDTVAGDVVSRLEWVDGPVAPDLARAFGVNHWERRPDRDVYLAGGTLWWLRVDEFPPFHMAASWADGRLTVTGRYYFRLGSSLEWLRRLRHRRRLPQLRAHRFSTLLYYLVYYPILWRLTRFHGLHLAHGAAVALPGGGSAVFFGMPGCGKSTLAVSLLGDPGVRMLSDNLILYDGTSVAACPELLLLDRASIARIPREARTRLTPVADRRVFERDAYRPAECVLDRLPVRVAAWVGRAEQSAVEPITAERCAQRARGGSTTAKEVRRFETMASLLDVLADCGPGDGYADLNRLLSGVPCYALWLSDDDAGPAVLERMRALDSPRMRG